MMIRWSALLSNAFHYQSTFQELDQLRTDKKITAEIEDDSKELEHLLLSTNM